MQAHTRQPPGQSPSPSSSSLRRTCRRRLGDWTGAPVTGAAAEPPAAKPRAQVGAALPAVPGRDPLRRGSAWSAWLRSAAARGSLARMEGLRASCSGANPGRDAERRSSLPPASGSLHPACQELVPAGSPLWRSGRAPGAGRGRRQDSPGLGGTALGRPLPPPGGGAVRLFSLPVAFGGAGKHSTRRWGEAPGLRSGRQTGCRCRRRMVLLGKQHPPLPPFPRRGRSVRL